LNCNSLIERYGKSLNILRTATVQTKGYIRAHDTNDSQADLIARYDSALVAGEAIQDGSDYYLTAQVSNVGKGSSNGYKKGILLICNASVTTQALVSGAYATVASAVHCLITKQRMTMPSDEALYREGPRSNEQVNYVYLSSAVVIGDGYYLLDGTRKLKILGEVSPYVWPGILEAQAILED
jgi:hypothetical protein